MGLLFIGFWSECDGNILSMAKSRLLHLLSRLSGRVIYPQEVPWTPSNPVVIGDDITREILKFLPVKSLMRFKCVSKGWLSIITDPSFTSAYTAGVEAVMVFRPRVMMRDPYKIINYMCIDDTGPTTTCEAYHHSTVDHGGQRFVNTGVVNGLICFFNNYQLRLYNIATREKVQIPVGGRAPKGDTQKIGVGYRFGYDPATKLYKILKLSTIFDCIGKDQYSFASTYTEILTIGVDSSWRVIDSIQSSIPLTNEGIYSGGVIYGTEGKSWNSKRFLTAFHVGEERFQCIPFPPPTLDGRLAFFLLSFFPGPCLALVSCGDEGSNTYNIYRFSFGEEAAGGGGGGGEPQGGCWKKEILTLPDEDLSPEGIFPNGKVLISDTSDSDPPRFFLYSPITKEYQMLVVTNWNVGRELGSPVVPRSDSYVEENIVSLKRLTSSSSCT